MPFRLLYILFLLVFVVMGCSRHSDPRLLRLEQMASANQDSAKIALDSLQAIAPAQLSDADRHFYDFLSVKIADKAYVDHASDSLILSVISYEEANQGYGRYPEALYYGGRVYSDLGDFPTALQYFQQALDELPEDADPNLKGRILSQTGRLLNTLRLYKEAIPYVKSSQELSQRNKDTVNDVYDLQLLGDIHLHIKNYSAADSCFIAALGKSDNLPVSFRAKSSMYRAVVKYHTNQLDSALILIRNTPDLVKPISRNNALAIAADIYLESGILDSAYYFAHELITSDDFTNRKSGYHTLLSTELSDYINPDTAKQYILEYRRTLDKYLNENENMLAVIQKARYNYELHERERDKAEMSNENLRYWIVIILFIVLILIVIILYLKNRNKNNVIRLHDALENITMLEQSLRQASGNKPDNEEKEEQITSPTPVDSKENITAMRERLKQKLMALYKSSDANGEIPPAILQSDSYHKLLDAISHEKEVKDRSKLWLELENDVIKSSPNFKSNLQLLLGGRLSSLDLHTAILVKCGITPLQMAIVFNRTKGTIVSRREAICKKIYGESLGTKVIDGIIRLL